MVGVLVIFAVLILATFLFLFVATRAASEVQIPVNRIPSAVAQLKATGKDKAFAVFLFRAPDSSPENDDVNLQFSMDHDRLGLDWVLLSKQNVADEEKIRSFMISRGFAANKLTENEVTYLRADDGDIVGLGMQIATELYRLKPDDTITMIVDGFEWQEGA